MSDAKAKIEKIETLIEELKGEVSELKLLLIQKEGSSSSLGDKSSVPPSAPISTPILISPPSLSNEISAPICKEDSRPSLVVLRGAHGSGKSLYSKLVYKPKGWEIVSTDEYFTNNGKYKFDPKKVKVANDWCFRIVHGYLKAGKNVVVDNTNRTMFEVKRYLKLEDIASVSVIKLAGEYPPSKVIPQSALDKYKQGYQPYEYETTIKFKVFPDGSVETTEVSLPY